MASWIDPRKPTLFEGLTARSQLVECPLHAYTVRVERCSGAGECSAVCPVGVFGTDFAGRCEVVNEELCFGCMACVAQCADGGVAVAPRDARRYPSVGDILR
ncbi:MAG: ferredoxin family protein [Thaumarchaeota archaeon]|nr:ferredoxin family protein [Nitrososphaerota archaeon]